MSNKMSIRAKLITLFIALLGLLLALQGFLYYQYHEKVSERLGEAAFEVSKETASVFIYNQDFFVDSETYFINEQGEIFQPEFKTPENNRIQIRLRDNVNDKTIQLTNQFNKEFQIPIPRGEVNETISELRKRNLWTTLIIFIIGIIIASLITFNITKPLLAMNKAAKKIANGELGTKVDIDMDKYGQDVSDTIKQFNSMSTKVVEYQKQELDKQELEHMKELSSISRGLAHNLRNPLNTLQLSIEQLEQKHPDLALDNLSVIAKDQVQRIESWLQSFTLLMEQGVKKQPVKFKQFISTTAKQFDIQNLNCNLPEKFEYLGVEAELSMILQILIQNATESYDKETKDKLVNINCFMQSGFINIEIVDFGNGISDKVSSSLFKPYNTDKTYGSGMGLYIARRLIRHRYAGDIVLNANSSKGTTATITLSISDK